MSIARIASARPGCATKTGNMSSLRQTLLLVGSFMIVTVESFVLPVRSVLSSEKAPFIPRLSNIGLLKDRDHAQSQQRQFAAFQHRENAYHRLFSTTKDNPTTTANSDTPDKKHDWSRPDLFGTSLIDQTVEGMKHDQDYQAIQQRLESVGSAQLAREERARRRRALNDLGVPNFASFVRQQHQQQQQPGVDQTTTSVLQRKSPKILQLNIGLYCNQACSHCHVESSPLRKAEMMTAETAAQCLALLQNTPSITTLDITGGAPELNIHFRTLVRMARAMRGANDLEIIDRCNLTVLQEPGQEDLIDFLRDHQVRIVASLPCYTADNVNQQRGSGVFERSIAALLALNQAGYGRPDHPDLRLDLVYNPNGAFLPPSQQKLEADYKQQLHDNFGILFDSLLTITNMPIKRFADFLHRRGELRNYMDLLVRNFNLDTVNNIMCLDIVSVGYDGRIYDCDFNQQLGYTIPAAKAKGGGGGGDLTVFHMETLTDILEYDIRTDNHCFGCTAGQGSSCQGAVA